MRSRVAHLQLRAGDGAARTLVLTLEDIAEDLGRFPETECLPVYRTSMLSDYTAFVADTGTVEALSLLRIVNIYEPVVLDPVTGYVQLIDVSPGHHHMVQLVKEVVEVSADLMARHCRGLRRYRWRIRGVPGYTGIEADECWYLGEQSIGYLHAMDNDTADEYVDTVGPDLVVEMTDGPFDAQRAGIYRAQGARECWQFTGARGGGQAGTPEQVMLLDLQGRDGPAPLASSRALPGLTAAIISDCMVAAQAAAFDGRRQYDAIRSVLINNELVPVDAEGHPGGRMAYNRAINRVFIDHGVIAVDEQGNRVVPDREKQAIRTEAITSAVREDDAPTLGRLLEQGADPNARGRIKTESSALHTAAYYGHTDCARLLVDNGADIHDTAGSRRTPLGEAALWGHTDVARLLLDAGADIAAQDSYTGDTPLLDAAQYGRAVTVRLLLLRDASVSARNKGGNTALHQAAIKGDTNIIQSLLDHGTDIHTRNNDGVTPLELAARYGHIDAVRLLLEEGADVRAIAINGDTALHWAMRRNDPGMARLLLDSGADSHARVEGGYSPLGLAAKKGIIDLVRLLLDYGPAMQPGDNAQDMGNALRWAVKWDDADMVRLLLGHGAGNGLEAADRYGKTPLGWARARQDPGMANLLQEASQAAA